MSDEKQNDIHQETLDKIPTKDLILKAISRTEDLLRYYNLLSGQNLLSRCQEAYACLVIYDQHIKMCEEERNKNVEKEEK